MTAASWPPPHPHRAGIGEPLRRLEDARLLTGQGCYSDDFNLAGQVYAVVVRSPHAHARITAIETGHARAMLCVPRGSNGRRLYRGRARPDDLFVGVGEVTSQVASFPHGFHVCEVEIDPETGAAEIVRYTPSTMSAASSTR